MTTTEPEQEHQPDPVPDSAYSVTGANTGRPANLLNPFHYPVRAICQCGGVILAEHLVSSSGWEHIGRLADEAAAVDTAASAADPV